MMKRFLYALALLCACSACSDDEKAPAVEIFDVVIEGSMSENPLSVEVGGSLSFFLKLGNAEGVSYSWLLDNKEVGTGATYTFTPEETGSYKLVVVVKNSDGVATTKEIGVVTVVYPVPVIQNLLCGGETVRGDINVTASSELSFKVEADKAEGAIYYWIINGDTIENENVATLEYNLGLSGTLKVAVVNKDNVSVEKEVELVGPYKNGTYVFGTTNSGLCFIDENGVQTKDNVYTTVNPEESAGESGINDFQIYNNKVYMLLPQISYAEKMAAIIVADAQTMKKIDLIKAESFTSTDLGTIYNLAIVNEEKAYIGSNSIKEGNISSVRVLDIKNHRISAAPIEGTSGNFAYKEPYGGPGWARMLNIGDYTWVACGENLQVINHKTDMVEHTITPDDAKVIVEIVKGRDGDVYALVNGKTKGAYIVKVNTETFAIEYTTEPMICDGKKLTFVGGGAGNNHTAVSPISDELFFCTGSSYSVSPQIYKFNYTTQEVSLFTDISDEKKSVSVNGYMGVDSKGTLVIPVSGQWTYMNEGILTYDIQTGTVKNKDYDRITGEGNAVPTWMFQ